MPIQQHKIMISITVTFLKAGKVADVNLEVGGREGITLRYSYKLRYIVRDLQTVINLYQIISRRYAIM